MARSFAELACVCLFNPHSNLIKPGLSYPLADENYWGLDSIICPKVAPQTSMEPPLKHSDEDPRPLPPIPSGRILVPLVPYKPQKALAGPVVLLVPNLSGLGKRAGKNGRNRLPLCKSTSKNLRSFAPRLVLLLTSTTHLQFSLTF